MGRTVVVGGGITGLVCANLIRRQRPDEEVVLIEADDHFGGLLSCFDYGEEGGRFDIGAHNFTATGHQAVDELVLGSLPDGDWNELRDGRRDLAGCYYAGRLQLHTPYVDLRGDARLPAFIEDLKRHGDTSTVGEEATLEQIFRERFGPLITDGVFRAIGEKLYGKPLEALAPIAGRIVTLQRVCAVDQDVLATLDGEPVQSVLAFPEQREFPGNANHPTRGYYPKHYGMYRVIDGLVGAAEAAGVRLLRSTAVGEMKVDGGRVRSVVATGEQGAVEMEVDTVVWTVAVPQILKLLGVEVDLRGYDRPAKTVICSLLLDRPPAMGDLYYFYCFDEGYSTFRVTNFASYCPEAASGGRYRVSVELLVDDVPDGGVEELTETAIEELVRMGVIPGREAVAFARSEVLRSGFPMPTVRNNQLVGRCWEAVDALGIENLVRTGILSRPGLFFQTEVLAAAAETLADRGD